MFKKILGIKTGLNAGERVVHIDDIEKKMIIRRIHILDGDVVHWFEKADLPVSHYVGDDPTEGLKALERSVQAPEVKIVDKRGDHGFVER